MLVEDRQAQKRNDGLHKLKKDRFSTGLLACAITIHRSQSFEPDNVVVAIGGRRKLKLKRQPVRVAVTRAKKNLVNTGQCTAMRRVAAEERCLSSASTGSSN